MPVCAFGTVCVGRRAPVRVPSVRRAGGDPGMCLLVGDTDTDRKTAHAAGVPSVLVTFGPAGEDMAALNPAALLDHYNDLPRVVRDLIG